jgi:hypothetical protein
MVSRRVDLPTPALRPRSLRGCRRTRSGAGRAGTAPLLPPRGVRGARQRGEDRGRLAGQRLAGEGVGLAGAAVREADRDVDADDLDPEGPAHRLDEPGDGGGDGDARPRRAGLEDRPHPARCTGVDAEDGHRHLERWQGDGPLGSGDGGTTGGGGARPQTRTQRGEGLGHLGQRGPGVGTAPQPVADVAGPRDQPVGQLSHVARLVRPGHEGIIAVSPGPATRRARRSRPPRPWSSPR